ncbi:hypothetical protein QYF36_010455 [Acer negundo]|nr:hypothetical protein QYF36_010455 [Acer negundo]
MDVGSHADDRPELKPTVVFEGSAKEARTAPPMGQVDIGENENAYLFRVSLPGIRNNQSDQVFNRYLRNIKNNHSNLTLITSDSRKQNSEKILQKQQLDSDLDQKHDFRRPCLEILHYLCY